MVWVPEMYAVIIPNPHDPDGQWVGVADFGTKQEAVAYVAEKMGGDEKGRIGTLSHIPDEGWLLDLPNPQNPGDAWVFVDSFQSKRDAVQFVRDKYGGDSKGRIGVIDVMETMDADREGPKDWTPRRGG
jgi:hypothetical protein